MIAFTVIKIISVILAIVGTTYILPVITALAYGETQVLLPFIIPMICSWIFAFCMLYFGRKKTTTLSTRSGFVTVAFAWISASLFGAIPLYASGAIPSVTDAVFESVSGFSTTGATILSEIESLPRSINLWRCQTHWLGGMGIVALTVALLPLLGVGGFQLIKAETTGPEKGKVTPKIANTAKVLWFIYLGLTLIQALLLKIAGMDWVDSISHAFATLGTGGFSTRNASIGSYNSAAIDIICTVFMFLAAVNFSLYFLLFTGKLSEIKHNSEFKAFIAIVITTVVLVTLSEIRTYGSFFTSLRYSSFQIASILSTTGFSTSDFTLWTPFGQTIIFALFFIGGSSGSTSGGVKIVRWVVMFKSLKNEVLRMLHPHGIFTIQLDGKPGRQDVVFNVSAFFVLYFALLAFTTLFATLFGVDLFSSFTGALSMVGNIGPGFNALGPSCNYGFLPAAVKWCYCFAMLAGRLEFYTILIFFFPSYWKK